MALHIDCTWKSIDALVFRNLSSKRPTLSITSHDGNLYDSYNHVPSQNPTWANLLLPRTIFPITVQVLDDQEPVFEATVDLEYLCFISSDLADIEPYTFPVMFIEIKGEGFYTVQNEQVEELVGLARNNRGQILQQALATMSAKPVEFGKLKSLYHEVAQRKQHLLILQRDIATLKNKIANSTQLKKKHFPKLRKMRQVQEWSNQLVSENRKQFEQTLVSKKLSQELSGQLEMSNQFLNAHLKKYTERFSNAQTSSLKTLIIKERFIEARKLKMLAELYAVFQNHQLLEKFELLGSTLHPQDRDIELSSSLGYACLMISQVANIFAVKLNNPVVFCGARSSIWSMDREYPLYETGKGSDKERFKTALELLFDNILQMFKVCGYMTEMSIAGALNKFLECIRNDIAVS